MGGVQKVKELPGMVVQKRGIYTILEVAMIKGIVEIS